MSYNYNISSTLDLWYYDLVENSHFNLATIPIDISQSGDLIITSKGDKVFFNFSKLEKQSLPQYVYSNTSKTLQNHYNTFLTSFLNSIADYEGWRYDFYNFGNYLNNGGDGDMALYMGDFDGASGGWRGHGVAGGATKIQVGEYYHVVFQLGGGIGNAWRNRNKLEDVSYPRPIANSNVPGYGQNNFDIYGPYEQSFGVLKAGLWYNRRCSDDEIRAQYDYFARRYPLQTR